ncbi:MAG: hypothetical protein BWY54_00543 [Candidatus Dependentiae bacterium ADurb.Bin331]|nr:MAG: hypothetical protein BWY54_00543 [Candidatus Dependentiae bacterium ADurb.Bin331]
MKKRLLILLVLGTSSFVQSMDVKPVEISKAETQLEQELQDAQKKYDDAKKKAEDPQREKELKDALDKSNRYYKLAANNPNSPSYQDWMNTGKLWQDRATRVETELSGLKEAVIDAQKDIDLIEGKLTALRESIPVPPIFNYKAELEREVIGLTPDEAQIIFDDQFSTIKKQNYTDQLKSLADLSAVAQTVGDQNSSDEAQQRIDEIQAFQKQPLPAPRNELEQRLGLQNKILSDQITAVSEEFVNQAKIVSDAIEANDINSMKTELAKVENLRAALQHYNLESNEAGMVSILDATIASLKNHITVEQPLPAEIENNKTLLTSVLDNTQAYLDAAAPIVLDNVVKFLFVPMGIGLEAVSAKAMEITPIADAVHKAGGQLEKGSQAVKKIAAEMSKLPQTVQRIEKYIDLAQGAIDTVKPVIEMLPKSVVGNIADVALPRMQKVLAFADKNRSLIEKGANFVAGGAQYVKTAAEYADQLSNSLKDALNTQQQAQALEQINKAQAIINREKLVIVDAATQEVPQLPDATQKMTFAKFFEPLKTTIASIGEYLRTFFETTVPILKTAQQRYDDAQSNYLKLLGYKPGDRPTEDEIQKRLTVALQDETKKTDIEQANKLLAKAVTDLATNYNKTLDTVNSAAANIEFLITGWDAMKINPPTLKKQAQFADWVGMMFDARDTQLAYLQTAMSGVKQIQSDLQGIKGTPAEQFGNDLVTRMSQLINGTMLDTIAQYSRAADALNEKLIEDKSDLQNQIVIGPGGL